MVLVYTSTVSVPPSFLEQSTARPNFKVSDSTGLSLSMSHGHESTASHSEHPQTDTLVLKHTDIAKLMLPIHNRVQEFESFAK